MREYCKEKLKSLVALRTNLFTCVIVLTGGVVGLFFTDNKLTLIVPFVIIGLYFDFIFLQNMVSIHKEIGNTLEELKNGYS